MYEIVRTQEEIDKVLIKADNGMDQSQYPGMSFEQGITDMFSWLIGNMDEEPI